jgi:putative transposase
MPLKDQPVVEAIKDVIGTSRKGRGKVIPMVQRKHPFFSSSKIRRVYEKQGFSLMKRMKKRKRNNPSNPATVPLEQNKEWAIDFMHDSLDNGRPIRSFNIIDQYNRECKGIYIRHSIPAVRVIEFMEQSIEKHGKPEFIRMDNGPELISKRFQLWLIKNNIGWSKIRKGCPQENCFIERFNRTMREDFLDANIFSTVDQANELAAEFQREYNELRPHESLNNLTPVEYAA